MPDCVYIADVATQLIGCAVIGLGVFAQFKPLEGARRFGGDGVANEKQATFVPVLFARNITIGLTILLLSLEGHRRALGMLLGCIVVTGLIDIRWCLKHAPGKLVTHATGTTIFATLSWVMLRSETT